MRLTLIAFAMGAASAFAVVPLAAQTAAQTATPQVTIDNFTFEPARLVVKAGTTVTWANRDDIPHTVASKDRKFKSKALDTDDSYSFTFTAPGQYDYFCSLHPHMTGTIVVEAAGGATP